MPINCPHCKARILPNTMIRTGLAGQRKAREPITKPPVRANIRQRIWRSMQIEQQFSVMGIVATAECRHSSVRALIAALLRVGYVRELQRSNHRSGEGSIYRLVKNTGPFAPRLRKDGTVYDLNLKQTLPGARHV